MDIGGFKCDAMMELFGLSGCQQRATPRPTRLLFFFAEFLFLFYFSFRSLHMYGYNTHQPPLTPTRG